MMKSNDFINMLKKALNSNTIYGWGMWGQIITDKVIDSKIKQYPDFYTKARVAKMRSLVGKNYFGFDCMCLVKSILWGWNGSATIANGGAKYLANGVPDVNADTMITKCSEVSTNFSNIVPGALVWVKGHVGVYIGDGQVIECTTNWDNKVLQSGLANIGGKNSKQRTWTKWGKLPFVDYSDQVKKPAAPAPAPQPAPAPAPKPQPAPAPAPVTGFKNGDKVKLNRGAKTTTGVSLASFVYDNVHDLTNVTATEGVIKYQGVVIARVYLKDLTKVTGSTVAPAPQKKEVKEGSCVKLNKGAKTTTGVSLASFVYDRVHIATNVKNGQAVIKYNGTIVARVYVKDLTVV